MARFDVGALKARVVSLLTASSPTAEDITAAELRQAFDDTIDSLEPAGAAESEAAARQAADAALGTRIDGVRELPPGSAASADVVKQLLEQLTYDLRAGGDKTGWADIASATVGGISWDPMPGAPNLARAAALTYTAPRVSVPVLANGPSGHRYAVWRLPEGTDITHWRVEYYPRESINNPGYVHSGAWVPIGTDSGWDYYRWEYETSWVANGVAHMDLQTDSTAAHIGTSTYLGNLLLAKVLAALGLDLAASSRGAGIRRKQDESGFEYARQVTLVANEAAYDAITSKDAGVLYVW